MHDWIDDWVKRLADQAFAGGDGEVVAACTDWLVTRAPGNAEAWSMQAEALVLTKQWFKALRWAERWHRETGHQEALLWLARIEMALQLYRQAERRLASVPAALRSVPVAELLQTLQKALPSEQRDNEALWIANTIDAFLAAKALNSEALCVCGEALLALGIRETEVARETGLAHYAAERKDDCLRCLSMTALNDDDALAALTDAQLSNGQIDAARQTLLRWHVRDHSGRAIALAARCDLASGQLAACEQRLHQAIDQFAHSEDVWKCVGAWLMPAQQPLAMRDHLRKATTSTLANNADAWAALALAEVRCGSSIESALALYQQAIARRDKFALALKNSGVCLFRLGRFAEARDQFRRAINAKPDYAMAWGELGMTCLKLQDYGESERALLTALVLKPREVDHWNNLGSMMLSCYRYHAAVTALERGLAIKPMHPLLRSNLANAYVNIGRFAEAQKILQQLQDEPHGDDVTSITNLLFSINYDPDLSSDEIIATYKKTISNGFPAQRYSAWSNPVTSQRRIRVAYVSADFCHHPCYHFVQPLLKHHRHDEFCVVAFSNVSVPDEKTAELKSYCDEWYDITTLSPDQKAELIYQKKIDILVDLSGHTAGNILPVFALKPAPLQMSWLGFGYTSGLATMDYFLCDEEMYPVGSERLFTEKAARIPLPCFVYKPSVYAPDVVPSPAQQHGIVHFGSLSRPIRLNTRCLTVWAEILRRVPKSRLILNCHAFGEQLSIDKMISFFTQQGIAASRLDIASTSPPWPVYQKMDIALDCFPHNSGTTLFEGLLMGVPFITRRDRVSMGRLGATIARGINHAEWIANSDEEYIDKAISLASDIPKLAALRASLRDELLQSALCDAADFTRRVEAQYHMMWQHWCEQQTEHAA